MCVNMCLRRAMGLNSYQTIRLLLFSFSVLNQKSNIWICCIFTNLASAHCTCRHHTFTRAYLHATWLWLNHLSCSGIVLCKGLHVPSVPSRTHSRRRNCQVRLHMGHDSFVCDMTYWAACFHCDIYSNTQWSVLPVFVCVRNLLKRTTCVPNSHSLLPFPLLCLFATNLAVSSWTLLYWTLCTFLEWSTFRRQVTQAKNLKIACKFVVFLLCLRRDTPMQPSTTHDCTKS